MTGVDPKTIDHFYNFAGHRARRGLDGLDDGGALVTGASPTTRPQVGSRFAVESPTG